jgi:hypothetical protein
LPKATEAAIELRDKHRADVITRLYVAEAKCARFKPTLDARDELRKEVQSWYADADPFESFEAAGGDYIAVVGPRENQSKISDMEGLFKRLKRGVFLSLCTITLKKLEAVIPSEELSKYVTQDRTGWRSVKVVDAKLSETGV